ncbi:hypothetical protein WJX84_003567 [Apatococcus fuscideae]|uniref:ABC transporter domain-containing protein n=1 Tax=Apatococcus fuscideae TaxID=2026836 RepID=A0AAW1SX34_9CHLO
MTDYILRLLGLEVCAETRVGNAMVRGISGGQKKRLTTGEMVIGPKRTLFMDEISTGLDASTTQQIVQCISNLVHLRDCTVLISLLQPPPETFNLFDDIFVLAAGRMVFQGPREEVVPFFESQHFKLPPRKGVADFLQEIVSLNDQEQYWSHPQKAWKYVTPDELANAFEESPPGQQNAEAMASPTERTQEGKDALVHKRYALTGGQAIKACMRRELTLMKRNGFVFAFRFLQLITLSFMAATIFVKTRMHKDNVDQGRIYINAIYFFTFVFIVNGYTESSITVQFLPVFYKLRDDLFYPVYAYLLPILILRLPYSVAICVLFNAIVYFSIGLSLSAGRFFLFLLTSLLMQQISMNAFRTCATIGRSPVTAAAVSFFFIICLILFNGFIIARGDLPRWWIWGFWLNPASWGLRSLSIIECLSPEWSTPFQGVPGFPAMGDNETVGEAVLEATGLRYPFFWVWIDFGALAAFWIVLNLATYFCLLLLGEPIGKKAVVTEQVGKPETTSQAGPHSSDSHNETAVSMAPSKPLDSHAIAIPSAQNGLDGLAPGSAAPGSTASSHSQGVVRFESEKGMGVSGVEADSMELRKVKQPSQRRPGASHMTLPFEPMVLTFQNIRYIVPNQAGPSAKQPAQQPGQAAAGLADLDSHFPQSSSHAPPAYPEPEPDQPVYGRADQSSSHGRIMESDCEGQDGEDALGAEFAALRAKESRRRSLSNRQQSRRDLSRSPSQLLPDGLPTPIQEQERPVSSKSWRQADVTPEESIPVSKKAPSARASQRSLGAHSLKRRAQPTGEGPSEKELELLKGITGAFRPGVLTALMGASGAGKTTLMDVLACRKTSGRIIGDVRVNGHAQEPHTFARVSGYVEQTDTHSPQTTVVEALWFSARLRQPSSVSNKTLKDSISEIMGLVELNSISGALVGLPGQSGLSVEQRKRLSIAVELVANPAVIMMDEPTSGLDARAAAIVIRAVRRIAETGRTMAATVHQPAIDIFEVFDELLLLKRGGETIYAGSLGPESCDLVAYFESIPGVPSIQPGYNPATWMLDISTVSAEARLEKSLAWYWQNSQHARDTEQLVEKLSQPKQESSPLQFSTRYHQPYWRQYLIILLKYFVCYWRYPQYNSIRIITTTLAAVLFGSTFWQKGLQRQSPQGVDRTVALQYVAVIMLGFNNAFTILPVLAVERGVFYRERAAGYYASLAYGLAQGDVEIPFLLLQSTLYSVIFYFMVHLEYSAAKFFWFLLFMTLTLTWYTYMGVACLALSPSVPLAAVASTTVFASWTLFAGFVAPMPNIPGWWIWFYWLSPTAYSIYGLVGAQLGDVDNEYLLDFTGRRVSVSQYLLDSYGLHHYFIGYAVLVLCAFIVFFRCVALLALSRLNYQKR